MAAAEAASPTAVEGVTPAEAAGAVEATDEDDVDATWAPLGR